MNPLFRLLQWCQSNFSSIEDIKTRRNRGDFRQNIESIEEMKDFMHPRKWHFWADLRGSAQIIVQIRTIKKKTPFIIFWGQILVFLKHIFHTNVQNI
jgi:hypothetical protein